MAEPGMTIEIEDVLSSIRRLVSQEAGAPRSAATLRRPMAAAVAMKAEPMPEAEAEIEAAVEPELEAAAEPEAVALAEAEAEAPLSLDADCLVLTPALRVGSETPDLAAERDAGAEREAVALAEAFAEVDPVEVEEAAAAVLPAEAAAAPPIAAEEADGDLEATAGTEAELEAPLVLSEAEALLADAEAALSGTDAVLESAELALDEAWAETAAEDAALPEAPLDLGDELARLETTIAEMEAAVAESGIEFEPEEGDRFEAAGAEPLVDLPEAFDAEAFDEDARDSVPVVREGLAEAVSVADVAAVEEAELADEPAASVDPDLEDAAWAEPEAGMDWAEAAISLARPSEARRLHLSDAVETRAAPEIRRSSYETTREAIEEAEPAGADEVASVTGFEDGLIDEEMLREMVAQMIREELRGTLGERITQNVRRLVRREIQRALMGQDFE